MPDMYDEFGRKVEKPKKRRWTTYEPDYPMTFAVSVVNRETGEGIKDVWAEPKLKSPKGAMKNASKNILMGWYNQAISDWPRAESRNAVGLWLHQQRGEDLDFVARPVVARKDVDLHQDPDPDEAYLANYLFHAMGSWRDAMDYVSSPPPMPQRFKEEPIEFDGRRWASGKPGGVTEYHQGSYHGESTIIPLVEITG